MLGMQSSPRGSSSSFLRAGFDQVHFGIGLGKCHIKPHFRNHHIKPRQNVALKGRKASTITHVSANVLSGLRLRLQSSEVFEG